MSKDEALVLLVEKLELEQRISDLDCEAINIMRIALGLIFVFFLFGFVELVLFFYSDEGEIEIKFFVLCLCLAFLIYSVFFYLCSRNMEKTLHQKLHLKDHVQEIDKKIIEILLTYQKKR
jgi:hypothetical protein